MEGNWMWLSSRRSTRIGTSGRSSPRITRRAPQHTTAAVPWQDELAEAAKRSAQAEKGGGGGLPTISFRGGVISVDDEEVDGGELDVVILQAIHENRYFGAKFDPNNTTAPKCYAFADPDR